ncbi:hypothetical protein KIS4809_5310 [Bacillus sp. ZZV12-4809]|nr:hypothetical protein KIS4809_5310 [Bacillus sp. ZZV12-4809]
MVTHKKEKISGYYRKKDASSNFPNDFCLQNTPIFFFT